MARSEPTKLPDSRAVGDRPAEDDEPLIEVPDEASPVRALPSRRTVTLITVPLIALTVISYVGDAIMPTIVDQHPLLLTAMNPRNRNLILVANQLDAVSYYVVATIRLFASDPLWFLIGYWYGESALRWAEKRTRTFGDTLRWFERGFAKAAYPLVVIAPNNWICLFAGAAGMSVPVFIALNLTGTLGRLYLIRVLGDAFSQPIDWVLEFIRDYRIPLLVFSILMVAVLASLEYRKGDSEISNLAHLDDRLDDSGTDPDRRGPADGEDG